ncbi:MAG: hypothetical protein Q9180_002990 [Flavoplaca navasiana]
MDHLADQFSSSRQPSSSSIPDPKGTDPGMDAIEDICRLFMVEGVEHGAVADPQATEQPSSNSVSSMWSCNDGTPTMCQHITDQESTSDERQKGVGLTEELKIPQYRIRRPLSGSRRSQPTFLNPDASSTHHAGP